MSAFIWFVLGFAVAQFVGMVTTTSPARAAENLRAWGRVVWPRRT